jgi:hypothetical protein
LATSPSSTRLSAFSVPQVQRGSKHRAVHILSMLQTSEQKAKLPINKRIGLRISGKKEKKEKPRH